MKIKSLAQKKKYWLAMLSFFVVFVAIGTLINTEIAHAEPGVGSSVQEHGSNLLEWLFSWIISALGSIITTLVGLLIEIARYNDFINADAVLTGWVVLRDIANMFVVLVLLLIAFGTILRLDQYKLNSMLPKLILMAVLVNFSRVISGLIIDASQVVTLTFLSAYQEAGAGNIMNALKLDKVVSINTTSGKGELIEAVKGEDLVGAYFFATILMIVSVATVAVYLVVFAVRIVALWLLIVVSPMAYILSAVPGGQQYSSQWWGMFSKYVVVGPVLAFFLWLSLASLPNLTQDLTDGGIPKDLDGKTGSAFIVEAATPTNTLGFIISIAMLMGSLAFAQKLGGVAGKAAGTAATKLQQGGNWAGKKAFAGATYYPRELGAKVKFRAGDRVLGAIGRNVNFAGIGTAAMVAQNKLAKKASERTKSSVADIQALNTEQAALLMSRQQKRGVIGTLTSGILGTQTGQAIDATVRARALRDPIRLYNTYQGDQTRKDEALDRLTNQDDPEANRQRAAIGATTATLYQRRQALNEIETRNETQAAELAAIEREISARTADSYQAITAQVADDAGITRDVSGNMHATDDTLSKALDSFYRRNPHLMPATAQTVTSPERLPWGEGGVWPRAGILNRGDVLDADPRIKLARTMTSSQIENLERSAINSDFFDLVMQHSIGPSIARALNALPSNAGEVDIQKAIAGQMSGVIRSIRNGGSKGADMQRQIERGMAAGGSMRAAIVQNTTNNAGNRTLPNALHQDIDLQGAVSRAAVMGNAGVGGGTPTSQEGIDFSKYRRTQQLYAEHGEKYEESDEYKQNPNQYYQVDNYRDVNTQSVERDILLPASTTDLDAVGGGAFEAINDYYQADGVGERSNLARLMVNMDDLGADFAGKNGLLLDWEKDGAVLEGIMEKLLKKQQELYNLDEQELTELERALRATKNIAVVGDHLTPEQVQQTASHEAMEAAAREDSMKPLIDALWNAMDAATQQQTEQRVRDLFGGANMSLEDVKREFFAEAGANNNNRFGRQDGINFTDRQRKVLETWQFSEESYSGVTPQLSLPVEELAKILQSVLSFRSLDNATQNDYDIPIDEIKDLLTDLTEAIGDINIPDLPLDDLTKALTKMRSDNNGAKMLSTLAGILFNAKRTNTALRKLGTKLEAKTKPSADVISDES